MFYSAENFWQEVSKIMKFPHLTRSDQLLFNYGLIALGVTWQRISGASYLGECRNGMKVSTLPPSLACRVTCSSRLRDSVYIWHARSTQSGKAKVRMETRSGIMFLLPQWTTKCNGSSLVGVEWLHCISSL